MNDLCEIVTDLRESAALYREILSLVEREAQALGRSGSPPSTDITEARTSLLPRLNKSLTRLRQHRMTWQRLDPAERARQPETGSLLRQNQDLIMKILVLDRENEQALLRRGMFAPQQLPSVNQQRPHYVADLYRRAGLR